MIWNISGILKKCIGIRIGKIMYNYKIIIKYDGSDYNGWQKQGNTKNTIQGALEMAVKNVTGEEAEVIGSGRTDAGVHAFAQVANFKLARHIDSLKLKEQLNRNVHDDICILSVEEADIRFHSRLNAKGKKYLYRIQNTIESDVFSRNYKYHYDANLDIELMRKAAQLMVGKHDFRSFCSNKHMKKSTVRTVYSIDITKDKYGEIQILYYGNGFLYNMVRIMTGTLIEVGRGIRDYKSIKDTFSACDRQSAGVTAPACGLMLIEVEY